MLWVTTLSKIEHNGMLTTRRTAPIKNALPRDRRGVVVLSTCVQHRSFLDEVSATNLRRAVSLMAIHDAVGSRIELE